MQIRECEDVPNWVERLVHEVKVVQIVLNFVCSQMRKTVNFPSRCGEEVN